MSTRDMWDVVFEPVPDEATIRAKVGEEIARALEAKAGHRCPECGGKTASSKPAPGGAWGAVYTSRCGGGHTWHGPHYHLGAAEAAAIAREIGGA